MDEIKKIYSDDRNLRYKTTKLSAINSRRDIDGILARWGITKTMWVWDLPNDSVELTFELTSEFDARARLVRLKPPTIWKKRGKRSRSPEEIDWKISMRIFHWYIKNQLLMSYAQQSSKIVAFLPHIVVNEQQQVLSEVILPHLDQVKRLEDKT